MYTELGHTGGLVVYVYRIRTYFSLAVALGMRLACSVGNCRPSGCLGS